MGILNDLETLIDDANDTLGDLNGLIGQLQVQGFINFLAPSSTVSEAGSTHSVQVVLSLLGGTLLNPIIVPINVAGGTATSPGDFTLPATSVTFPVGSANGATQAFNIAITNDAIVENNETIVLQLGTISGPGTPGTLTQHTVTITDDDVATWCAVFLDGTGLGGFVTPAPLPGYPGTHGSYDSADDAVVASWQGEYYWGVMRWQPSPAITVTRIKAWLTVNPGTNPSGHGIYVNETSVQSLTVSQGGTANYQIEWTGELTTNDIRISTTAWIQGSARITRVEIEGTGSNPFSGRDCP